MGIETIVAQIECKIKRAKEFVKLCDEGEWNKVPTTEYNWFHCSQLQEYQERIKTLKWTLEQIKTFE